MHLLTLSFPVKIESIDDYFIISNPNFIFKTKASPSEETIYLNFIIPSISTESQIDENLTSIVNKLEKYQQNKMSEKEIGKMINKLKENSTFSEICIKMTNQEPLNKEDVLLLTNNQSKLFYKIDYKDVKLDENYIINDINFENLLPLTEFQNEFKEFYNKEKAEQIQIQKNKIASILGQEPESRKSVIDYLKEKKEQIATNSAIIYQIDPTYPLPQANDIERILNWGQDIFNSGEESMELSLLQNDAHNRDVHYYSRALCFLRFVYIDDKSLCLTHSGEVFFGQNLQAKKLILIDILSQDKFIESYLNNTLTDEELLDQAKALGYSETTMKRRLSSLNSWKKFLFN